MGRSRRASRQHKQDARYSITPEEVESTDPFNLEFPRSVDGHLRSIDLIVAVESADFRCENSRKTLCVPPRGDSPVCVFMLEALEIGPLVLNVEIFQGDRRITGQVLRSVGSPSAIFSLPVQTSLAFELENAPDEDDTEPLRDSEWQLVEVVRPSKVVFVPLRHRHPYTWLGERFGDELFRNSQFVLAVRSAEAVDELIRKVNRLVIVASSDELDRHVRHALRGLDLEHIPAPPTAIQPKPGFQYFLISRRGRGWDAIMRSQTLAIFAPHEIKDPEFELEIVLDC